MLPMMNPMMYPMMPMRPMMGPMMNPYMFSNRITGDSQYDRFLYCLMFSGEALLFSAMLFGSWALADIFVRKVLVPAVFKIDKTDLYNLKESEEKLKTVTAFTDTALKLANIKYANEKAFLDNDILNQLETFADEEKIKEIYSKKQLISKSLLKEYLFEIAKKDKNYEIGLFKDSDIMESDSIIFESSNFSFTTSERIIFISKRLNQLRNILSSYENKEELIESVNKLRELRKRAKTESKSLYEIYRESDQIYEIEGIEKLTEAEANFFLETLADLNLNKIKDIKEISELTELNDKDLLKIFEHKGKNYLDLSYYSELAHSMYIKERLNEQLKDTSFYAMKFTRRFFSNHIADANIYLISENRIRNELIKDYEKLIKEEKNKENLKRIFKEMIKNFDLEIYIRTKVIENLLDDQILKSENFDQIIQKKLYGLNFDSLYDEREIEDIAEMTLKELLEKNNQLELDIDQIQTELRKNILYRIEKKFDSIDLNDKTSKRNFKLFMKNCFGQKAFEKAQVIEAQNHNTILSKDAAKLIQSEVESKKKLFGSLAPEIENEMKEFKFENLYRPILENKIESDIAEFLVSKSEYEEIKKEIELKFKNIDENEKTKLIHNRIREKFLEEFVDHKLNEKNFEKNSLLIEALKDSLKYDLEELKEKNDHLLDISNRELYIASALYDLIKEKNIDKKEFKNKFSLKCFYDRKKLSIFLEKFNIDQNEFFDKFKKEQNIKDKTQLILKTLEIRSLYSEEEIKNYIESRNSYYESLFKDKKLNKKSIHSIEKKIKKTLKKDPNQALLLADLLDLRYSSKEEFSKNNIESIASSLKLKYRFELEKSLSTKISEPIQSDMIKAVETAEELKNFVLTDCAYAPSFESNEFKKEIISEHMKEAILGIANSEPLIDSFSYLRDKISHKDSENLKYRCLLNLQPKMVEELTKNTLNAYIEFQKEAVRIIHSTMKDPNDIKGYEKAMKKIEKLRNRMLETREIKAGNRFFIMKNAMKILDSYFNLLRQEAKDTNYSINERIKEKIYSSKPELNLTQMVDIHERNKFMDLQLLDQLNLLRSYDQDLIRICQTFSHKGGSFQDSSIAHENYEYVVNKAYNVVKNYFSNKITKKEYQLMLDYFSNLFKDTIDLKDKEDIFYSMNKKLNDYSTEVLYRYINSKRISEKKRSQAEIELDKFRKKFFEKKQKYSTSKAMTI